MYCWNLSALLRRTEVHSSRLESMSWQASVMNSCSWRRLRGFRWKAVFHHAPEKEVLRRQIQRTRGHSILPRHPIHFLGNVASRNIRELHAVGPNPTGRLRGQSWAHALVCPGTSRRCPQKIRPITPLPCSHDVTRLVHLSCHDQVRVFIKPINAIVLKRQTRQTQPHNLKYRSASSDQMISSTNWSISRILFRMTPANCNRHLGQKCVGIFLFTQPLPNVD